MKLHVIGSGSEGNCYVLKSRTGKMLILECGMRYSDVLKIDGFKPSNVECLLITHEHGDHAKFHKQFTDAGIKTFTMPGTREALGLQNKVSTSDGQYRMDTVEGGEFSWCPFHVEHDAVDSSAYWVHHKEIGLLVFVTDTKEVLPREDVDHWLIEANYDHETIQKQIDAGIANEYLSERIASNHMSIDTCCNILKESSESYAPKSITLCHLSERNSDETLFKRKVYGATGLIPNIAKNGVIIEL